jgi:hypothetical protein
MAWQLLLLLLLAWGAEAQVTLFTSNSCVWLAASQIRTLPSVDVVTYSGLWLHWAENMSQHAWVVYLGKSKPLFFWVQTVCDQPPKPITTIS